MGMRDFVLLSWLFAVAVAGVIPHDNGVKTVTVIAPCEIDSAIATTIAPALSATPVFTASSSATATSDPGVVLNPVSGPAVDRWDLRNVVPKTNVTMHYKSPDQHVTRTDAEIAVQLKIPAVLLEDIAFVSAVICSGSEVSVHFNDKAGYEAAVKEWPASEFLLFTNHLGNCDVTSERGVWVARGLQLDEEKLMVRAKAEKSDFQNTAGYMSINYGQFSGPSPINSTAGPYSNTTALSKRKLSWDPTFSVSYNKALDPNTPIAFFPPYFSVIANQASLASTATLHGHLSYNFWKARVDAATIDLDVTLDVALNLTATIHATGQHNYNYAVPGLDLAPISIAGILTLGPALTLSTGAHLSASASVSTTAISKLALADGSVHLDLLQRSQSSATGWKPTLDAHASLDSAIAAQFNPFVELGVSVAMEFLGGLLDLSSGISANATLTNQMTLVAAVGAGGAGAGGGEKVCEDGLQYVSDFLFVVEGFVTQFWNVVFYEMEMPVVERCWALGMW